MRMTILQHTPDEGPGMISDWATARGYDIFIYHPAQFGQLPTAEETDFLVLLGGPMSPNDDWPWIRRERALIKAVLARHTPIYGACFGAQQITQVLGYPVTSAPAKEVGWGPITRQSTVIPGLPASLTVLHWHQEMFQIPAEATRLFASDALANQGFVLDRRVVGLQCHLEPAAVNVREMVVNDGAYLRDSVLHQTAAEVLAHPVPAANRTALYTILDYMSA